jgi:NitT/TauT family transport system substrate-binding protein
VRSGNRVAGVYRRVAIRRERQESIYKEVAGLPSKPYPSVAGLQKMIEVYDWREMRRHKPEDFFDASFVTELDKSGYIDGLYAKAKN